MIRTLRRLCLLILLLPTFAVGSTSETIEGLFSYEPHPSLTPQEVIRIQTQALMANDEQDRGIQIAFRFATPTNKRLVGPLDRFKEIMKTGMYRPMLNAQDIDYKNEFQGASLAAQTVIVHDVVGAEHHFMFVLRKQTKGPHKGCWLTESVFSKPKPPAGPKPLPI